MAGRPGINVRISHPADGGVSPNRYVPVVSAEIRAHWPPKAPLEDVLATIDEAAEAAKRQAELRHRNPILRSLG